MSDELDWEYADDDFNECGSGEEADEAYFRALASDEEAALLKWPDPLPALPGKGLGLVTLTSRCHSSGMPTGRRDFAVPVGVYMLHRTSSKTSEVYDELVVSESDPCGISFLDSNSEYHFTLPRGSMEFTEERGWFPRRRARYWY